MAGGTEDKVTSDEITCNEKGEVEITMFQAARGIPIPGSPIRVFPRGDPGSSWISIEVEFAVEGSLSFKLPGSDEKEAQKVADGWKTRFLNSVPLAAFKENFLKSNIEFTHTSAKNLKMKLSGVTASGTWSVGEVTLGECNWKVPNFSAKPKDIDALSVPITITIVSLNMKSQVAQIFPVAGALEIPLLIVDLPPSAVIAGSIKLVLKLSAGLNGVKLAEEAGIKVAEEAGEEAAAGFAAEAAVVLVAVVISVAIVIVLEKLLYGAVDDFKTLDERANEACDAFAKAFAAGLKADEQPSVEEKVAGPNADGFKAGTEVRSKVLAKWRSEPPTDVKAKMDKGMKLEDAVKAVGIPDNVFNDSAANARAAYAPKAQLAIATDFVKSHGSQHAMIAATIEHWYVGSNTTGNDQINRVITPAGWANVPDTLKDAYKSLTPPATGQTGERLRIQGVDPEPTQRTPEQAQAEWDAWAKKNSGLFGASKPAAAGKFMEFFPDCNDAMSDPRFKKYFS
jgi:hypothetical protein